MILVLVVAAMLALILIQAYQTRQLYDRKSTEFKARFATTLDRIAMRHEKAEDLRQYLQIVNKDFSVTYKDILKEEFKHLLSAQESISIEDTSVFEDGRMQSYLIIKGKSYDSISGVTAEQRVLARDVRQLRDLFSRKNKDQIDQDSIKLAIQLDQRVIHQIFKKARFVNEMMLQAFRNNVYAEPAERLQISFLDSVISTEIETEDLPKNYEFMLTDEFRVPIEFKNAPTNYNKELDTSVSHFTLLFPSNTLDEDLYLYLSFPEQSSFLIKEMWSGLIISLSLVILIIIAISIMFRTILTQKKLSEMKSDFISNMTHEFKTPISTISLACEALNDADMNQGGQINSPYVNMISEENTRLSLLVERILQSAILDKGELRIKEEDVILNELLEDLVSKSQLNVSSRGGSLHLEMPKELVHIRGDRFHIRNLISNLIDNAIKYSKNIPEVTVSLRTEGKSAVLSIKDKGIGIKKEYLSKIFDKLYRIPTGNIHNVKGFGLGLSYVKAIADLHGWQISVKSKPDEGSEFTINMNL